MFGLGAIGSVWQSASLVTGAGIATVVAVPVWLCLQGHGRYSHVAPPVTAAAMFTSKALVIANDSVSQPDSRCCFAAKGSLNSLGPLNGGFSLVCSF